jgi:hypothetical protein
MLGGDVKNQIDRNEMPNFLLRSDEFTWKVGVTMVDRESTKSCGTMASAFRVSV